MYWYRCSYLNKKSLKLDFFFCYTSHIEWVDCGYLEFIHFTICFIPTHSFSRFFLFSFYSYSCLSNQSIHTTCSPIHTYIIFVSIFFLSFLCVTTSLLLVSFVQFYFVLLLLLLLVRWNVLLSIQLVCSMNALAVCGYFKYAALKLYLTYAILRLRFSQWTIEWFCFEWTKNTCISYSHMEYSHTL